MNPLFQVHKLNETGLKRAAYLAEAFNSLVSVIDTAIPDSCREKSICLTKLEEACFFAKKAIASKGENQIS